ncbi:DNA (cytosine-5-)-methyltransferase [Maribacter algarum]|uniref:Cytosine-specific methyltransferase n=1 Tax=Maribacter algarum (ex Zhang et al. 2020) TaxID=2578118 RepID=A0A5S3PR19_9FLAO|nr:DNA (cytosine-5-)-methyltransferase [Maribacter algarum]TMM57111.1 DNA (cytosine-5-)-methyltransferase [Maribacter algarum]
MPIRVIELFAGVGGFRIGLEGYPKREDANYEVVWSNQWEPSTKTQHANRVYENRWPNSNHYGANIEEVIENDFYVIPDHDLLVGGFPCQDYSVATTLKNSKGLIGKKGVLWWSIEAILRRKEQKPKYLMLENVDRLLKSPSKQRGRDFAVMLASLNNLGYAVEWRVINAAEYGMPQRRRRVFFLAYHKSSDLFKRIESTVNKEDWLDTDGIIASAFPIREILSGLLHSGTIGNDLIQVSEKFNLVGKDSPFANSGLMINGEFITAKTIPSFGGPMQTLGDMLIDSKDVPEEFFITKADITKAKGWKYLKGAKKEVRQTKEGFKYNYSEGSMIFPDALDNASRTIITGEGGASPSRFKHVVEQDGRLRRLMPVELERLNMFPDNHTQLEGISDTKRAFFMGNALVVGIVEKLGQELARRIHVIESQKEFV